MMGPGYLAQPAINSCLGREGTDYLDSNYTFFVNKESGRSSWYSILPGDRNIAIKQH